MQATSGVTKGALWEEVSGERMGTAFSDRYQYRNEGRLLLCSMDVAGEEQWSGAEGGAVFRLDFEVRAEQLGEVTH